MRAASCQPLWFRGGDVEDVGPDLGQDLRVTAAGCPFVQQHLGRHRETLTRDLLLSAQLAELPAEVVASPPSDEQVGDVLRGRDSVRVDDLFDLRVKRDTSPISSLKRVKAVDSALLVLAA